MKYFVLDNVKVLKLNQLYSSKPTMYLIFTYNDLITYFRVNVNLLRKQFSLIWIAQPLNKSDLLKEIH